MPAARLVSLVVVACLAPVHAQGLRRLADPHPTPQISAHAAREFCARLGDWLYYPGFDPQSGRELWRVHLSQGKVELVRDLVPGRASSDPHSITPFAGGLLLFASTPQTGFELWRLDAASNQLSLVHDIRPGPASSRRPHPRIARRLGSFGGRLYFAVHDPVTGSELWQTDGSKAGTSRVALLGAGSPEGLLDFQATKFGAHFFTVDQAARKLLVWSSDGTSIATRILRRFDLSPAEMDCPPYRLCSAAGLVLLVGPVGVYTPDGLKGLRQLPAATGLRHELIGCLPPRVPQARPRFLFSGGTALWHSDATPLGTYSIDPGAGLGVIQSGGQRGTNIGGRHLFFGFDLQHGEELWSTDGSQSGTQRLIDLRPGPLDSQGSQGLGVLRRLVGNGTQAWFVADDGKTGAELWVTEGTPASTQRLTDLRSGPASSEPRGLQVLRDGSLVCLAEDAQGTVLLRAAPGKQVQLLARNVALEDRRSAANRIRGLQRLHRRVLFAAADAASGSEPWVSDGSAAGTRRLLDLRPGPESSLQGPDPSAPRSHGSFAGVVQGRWLWFTAWPRSGQLALLRSDGTAAGTSLQRQLELESQRGWTLRGRAIGEDLLLEAYTASKGRGLYRYRPASGQLDYLGPQRPVGWVALGEAWLFWTRVGSSWDLWRSDGSAAGTRRVFGSTRPLIAAPRLAVVGEALFFIEAGSPDRLWRSDGSVAGTRTLRSGQLRDLCALGDRLITLEWVSGFEVLRGGDGSLAGTVNIAHGLPAGAGGLVPMRSQVLFRTGTGLGLRLWRSDGSNGGTYAVASLLGEGKPPRMQVLGGLGARRILFRVENAALGRELWVSDGTTAGTGVVADLSPGLDGDNAAEAVVLDRHLLFLGRDPAQASLDQDLWSWRPGAMAWRGGQGCGQRVQPRLSSSDPRPGQAFEMELLCRRAASGILLLAPPAVQPIQLGSGCLLHPNPGLGVYLSVSTSGTRRWRLRLGSLPSGASTKGLQLSVQAAVGPSSQGPFQLDFSNELRLVFPD